MRGAGEVCNEGRGRSVVRGGGGVCNGVRGSVMRGGADL